MIGANAVAAELAIQMLDTFDLTGWRFTGETVATNPSGTLVRVLITPVVDEFPPGTGYFIAVTVNEDAPMQPQVDAAIEKVQQLLTMGVAVPQGQTPDEALDSFFDGLNLPPDIAQARKQEVLDERHQGQQAHTESQPQMDKQEEERPSSGPRSA